jgi:hypothetical protein
VNAGLNELEATSNPPFERIDIVADLRQRPTLHRVVLRNFILRAQRRRSLSTGRPRWRGRKRVAHPHFAGLQVNAVTERTYTVLLFLLPHARRLRQESKNY